jgi:4-hydroxybenzoate polyprenyltransferase
MHQWVKNLLIFVPLMAAHRWSDRELCLKSILAFFSFSLVASSVYIINDLVDLKADRLHPRKKNRPFASGAVSVKDGFLLIPVILTLGVSLGYLTSGSFLKEIGRAHV